LNFIVVRSL
jgi:hypothetical protein